MGRLIGGCDRRQRFLPDCVDDYLAKDGSTRIVGVFVDKLE